MTYIFFGLLGLALGSFVNALVWRLREQDLRKGQRAKSKGQKARGRRQEVALKDLSILHGRSMCVHCKHTLAWTDLIPVVSWLQLGGKCRYCKKGISWQYPLVEVLVALLAVGSLLWWPLPLENLLDWLSFGLWVIALVPMTALVVYDIRWMEMPTKLIYAVDIIALTFVVLQALTTASWYPVTSGAIGALLLGGFFWLLYQLSGAKWIGGGDVRYGFAMGLFLGWQSMLFGLMLASYLGIILIIILIALRKYRKNMRIPFGPFLVGATYIAMLFGQHVVDVYKSLAGF